MTTIKKKYKKALSKEISGLLIVKVLAILGLWYLCFSHPVAPTLTNQKVSQHLLSN